MQKFFKVIAAILAVVFSMAFIFTTLAAVLMVNIERRLLNSTIYKNALAEQQIYTRLPRILAEQIILSMNYNPCAENPFACEEIPPDLMSCIENAVGPERYSVLTNGQEAPTEEDLNTIQPCLDQYGMAGGQGGNPLLDMPAEVQDCARQKLGNGVYDALYNGERAPTEDELNLIRPCFEQAGLSLEGGGPPPFMKNLSPDNWAAIITILIPPQDLQNMTENLLDQIFAYLNGNIEYVVLDLTPLKHRLSGQAGVEAVVQLLKAQPACAEEDLAKVASGIIGGDMPFCNPPKNVLNAMRPQIQEQLNAIIGQIPSQRVILEPQAPGGEGPSGILRMSRLIMRASPAIPLGFLLIITLLVVRTPKSWLRWWGIPTFFAGLLTLGISIAAAGGLEIVWINTLAGRIPSYISLGMAQMGHDLVGAVAHSLIESLTLGALMLSLLGLVMWVCSYFIKDKRNPSPMQPNIIEGAIPPAA